jgi:YqaJ-like recombinase protein
MIVHDVAQGTTEWLALRAGIPTASQFDNILTPGGKPCTPAKTERFLHKLLAERIMGHPITEAVSHWMGRGNAMEAEAVSYYEGIRDLDTVRVGLVTNDARTIGASPDRFVGEDGLLEIKVPAEHTHVAYLLTRAVDAEYAPQVQGQLWVTGRAWLDILSYHPEMPPALIRVERDEKYITILSRAVETFSEALEAAAEGARVRGWIV